MTLDSPKRTTDGNESYSNFATDDTSWCYLFVHRTRLEKVQLRLNQQFETFVHKSVSYTKVNKRIVKREEPTISGLLFIKGTSEAISSYLEQCFPDLHLVRDYSTGKTATIRGSEMATFMQIASMSERNVRFMLHPISHYAEGHTLVKVTSGILAGQTGYVVRLHGDRCLVTTLGNHTVAISGVHKDSIENASQYMRERGYSQDAEMPTTYQEEQKGALFLCPDNPMDILALENLMGIWTSSINLLLNRGEYPKALLVCFTILQRMAINYQRIGQQLRGEYTRHIMRQASVLWHMLMAFIAEGDIPDTTRQRIIQECDSFKERFPHMIPFLTPDPASQE